MNKSTVETDRFIPPFPTEFGFTVCFVSLENPYVSLSFWLHGIYTV